MLSVSNWKLFDLLLQQKETLFSVWVDSIILEKEKILNEKIKENGAILFDLLVNSFNSTEAETILLIEKNAKIISEQRVKSDTNIGNFVYNLNLARTILINYIHMAEIEIAFQQQAINQINEILNLFQYRTVVLYTEEKNKIIEEKTQFIDSSHKDRLTLLGQMTSSFIHEFRNPLTSVQGFIQLLKSDYPDMRYLNIISNELEQLNFRISQFLLLSKKELIGKEKVIFSLNDLVEEVLLFLYPTILDSKVKIMNNMKEKINICGYKDEIRQVLINIIFNAIDVLHSYRNDATIEIRCLGKNSKHIHLEIGNNGPMIPENLVQSIFEPFVTTKKLGTGLGLFVCREIIEKHKGELTCRSSIDQTVFTITLPIATDCTDLDNIL